MLFQLLEVFPYPTNTHMIQATGDFVITKASHGLTTSNTVGLATNGFV